MSETLLIRPRKRIEAQIAVPGDKSISHRAAILASLAEGESTIQGFLQAEDCLHTLEAMRQLGAEAEIGEEHLKIKGAGLRGLRPTPDPLDLGNAGTGLALLMGVASGQPFPTTLTGDNSLRSRPQGRIAIPLRQMGAEVEGRGEACFPPITISGGSLRGIEYSPPIPSAQVKSALLLAGLYVDGTTTVLEREKTRDHTERMLPAFGAQVKVEGTAVSIQRPERLHATSFRIPGDISSAAFFLVAAAILPGSRVTVRSIGLNPSRTGVLEVLSQMGAKVEISNQRVEGGEPVGDVSVEGGSLFGVEIGSDMIPRLIDEIPVLCVAAAVAEGVTSISGAPQLRQKESDRIAVIAQELGKMGSRIEPLPDGLIIRGGTVIKGAQVQSHGDHRIAMSLAIAGLAAQGDTEVVDVVCIATSFPEFPLLLKEL